MEILLSSKTENHFFCKAVFKGLFEPNLGVYFKIGIYINFNNFQHKNILYCIIGFASTFSVWVYFTEFIFHYFNNKNN